jgi:dihydrofolate reductase
MRTITAIESVTLDGVMQAPGGADEDTRGDFAHGGWARPYMDHVMGEAMGAGMAAGGPLLFGRRTYEQFASFWPHQTDGNPFTPVLDAAEKYVASTTLPAGHRFAWQHSTLLGGDVPAAVAALKAGDGADLTVLGSGVLVRALLERGLVDELVLMIHPLVLGSGTRLFPDRGRAYDLRLVSCVPTTTGVIIATMRPQAPTGDAR